MTVQTPELASGQPHMTERYGRFGVSGVRTVVPPSRACGLLAGRPESGKTSFFLTNPAGLLINLDRSSTPTHDPSLPPPPCQVWPAVDDHGFTVDASGNRFELKWSAVLDMIERLEEASRTNQPRPSTIYFDTFSSMLDLIKDWFVEQVAAKQKASNAPHIPEHWGDGFDTMRAWDAVYNQINMAITRLLKAGYGVWFACHVYDETTQASDRTTVPTGRVRLDMPPGALSRFYKRFEISLGIDYISKVEVVPVEKTVTVGNTTKTVRQNKAQTIRQPVLIVLRDDYRTVCKTRQPLPNTIEIPPVDGWEHFESLYLQCAKEGVSTDYLPEAESTQSTQSTQST